MSLDVFFAYHVAILPSIPMPLYPLSVCAGTMGPPSYFAFLFGARSACHFFHSVRNPQPSL